MTQDGARLHSSVRDVRPIALHTRFTDISFMSTSKVNITTLTPAERLELVEKLWESLTPDDIPLTPGQVAELDRREALYQANPLRGRPWRVVLDEIERRDG